MIEEKSVFFLLPVLLSRFYERVNTLNLHELVKNAGVVGAGGAGFPTHVKLKAKAEFILLNGAECEPLLRVDQQLMEKHPDEIIKGFAAAGQMTGAKKALIGIKGKHKKVISILRERIKALQIDHYMEVRELKDVYPAGDEQVLVFELTGRVVPEAGIPIDVGCVVINSETALNVYKALNHEPVTETYLTIGGDVPRRLTVKVPIGTPVKDVLRLAGIEDLADFAVIDGGPMMGTVINGTEGYVTKTTKALLVLKKNHPLIVRKTRTYEQALRVNKTCEQCRMCTDMCPRYLLGHNIQPHKMVRIVNFGLHDIEPQTTVYLCSQCNLCELFSCPINIYPRTANMFIKDKLIEKNIRYQRSKDVFEAHHAREWRLVPTNRLTARLGLMPFDKPAPLTEETVHSEIVYIARRQHIGAPAIPVVSAGESVKAGQLIGEIPENSLGAPVHSSISGTVVSVTEDYIAIRREK